MAKQPGSLHPRIYAVVARVPRGRVATYGQVAALAGLPRHARLVGYALHALPEGSELPWQRVINSRGEVSPRAMPGWDGYQRHLLEEEGVRFDAAGRVNLKRFLWEPGAFPSRAAKSRAAASPAPRFSVRRQLAAIDATLRPLGTATRAAGAKAYLKSDLEFYGLDTKTLRGAARAWLRDRPQLLRQPMAALVGALWRRGVFELRAFGVEILVARQELLEAADLDLLEDLLRRSRTWAFVDWIAPQVVGPLYERRPAVVGRRLDRWSKDTDFWLRRAALLTLLVPLRRGGGDWLRFSRYADAMLDEREFFIRKAIGWVLREVGKKRPKLVVQFLTPRLDRVSGLTWREAVKYLPVADRKRLSR
jgi:alkylated DNA nucleotide flippase Atl1/3-methyladenine DNA glycosylase AlkD